MRKEKVSGEISCSVQEQHTSLSSLKLWVILLPFMQMLHFHSFIHSIRTKYKMKNCQPKKEHIEAKQSLNYIQVMLTVRTVDTL